MIQPPPHIAVILSGGAARRMGDHVTHGLKILLKLGDQTLLQHIVRALEQAEHPPQQIVLNLTSPQKHLVPSHYPLALDNTENREGPLAGISAGLRWCQQHAPDIQWMLSVSGDTPFLPSDLGQRLIEKALTTSRQVVYSRSLGRHHPTIALWHTSLAESAHQALKQGIRKIDTFSSPYQPEHVDWEARNRDPFFNINTLKDQKCAAEMSINLCIGTNCCCLSAT